MEVEVVVVQVEELMVVMVDLVVEQAVQQLLQEEQVIPLQLVLHKEIMENLILEVIEVEQVVELVKLEEQMELMLEAMEQQQVLMVLLQLMLVEAVDLLLDNLVEMVVVEDLEKVKPLNVLIHLVQ